MGIEYKDNKKCRLVVYAGSDAYGKPVRYTRTVTYTSPRNAERQLRAFEREVEDGLKKEPNARISKMMEDYIESRKRRGRHSTTITGYESVKSTIAKTLGDPIAAKVTRAMIDEWIQQLSEDHAPKTVRNIESFLSAAYQRYVDLEILKRNPCKGAELPEGAPKERKILTEADIRPFYDALREHFEADPDLVVVLELALFCGMRRSEICGLRKENIDRINKTVRIEDARHRTGGRDVTGEGTKTDGSRDVIALPEFVYDDVVELISIHEQKALRDANLPVPEYLILGVCGEPLNPDVLYKRLKRFLVRYDLPDVNLHGLRHTCASMLSWLGRDMVDVQHQLRHARLSTTMDIYTHLFKDATAASKSIAKDVEALVK